MEQWLVNLLSEVDADLERSGMAPSDVAYSTKRRMAILRRWPDASVRAAEQDARNGKNDDILRYDDEVRQIKAAIPNQALTPEQQAEAARVAALQSQIDALHATMTDTVILSGISGDAYAQTLVTTTLQRVTALRTEQQTGTTVPWSPDFLLNEVITAANAVVARIVSIQLDALSSGDTTTAAACITAKTAILGLVSIPAVQAATDDASLIAALKAGYAAIVADTPSNIKAAYANFRL